jgi:hypothetical protein
MSDVVSEDVEADAVLSTESERLFLLSSLLPLDAEEPRRILPHAFFKPGFRSFTVFTLYSSCNVSCAQLRARAGAYLSGIGPPLYHIGLTGAQFCCQWGALT